VQRKEAELVRAIAATGMGNPAREIVCYTHDQRIDLIVMARNGHGRAALLMHKAPHARTV
jgi:hypothetical protein